MSKVLPTQQFREEDIFSKPQYTDTYPKTYAQIKKTLDNMLENALNQADISDYSSDYGVDDEIIFENQSQNVNLYIEGEEKLKVCTDLLTLDDLVDVFDMNTFTTLFNKEEIQNLRKLLPQQENEQEQNETLKMLFSGQLFKFEENPLNDFLQKAKQGSYTTLRLQEQNIQRKMGRVSLTKYYEDTLLSVKQKLNQENINKIKTFLKKRKAIKRVEELLSSDSDQSEKSFFNLRPDIDFDEVSVGNSTDGSVEDKDNRKRKPQPFGSTVNGQYYQNGVSSNINGSQMNGNQKQFNNPKIKSDSNFQMANGSSINNSTINNSAINNSEINNSQRQENDSNSNTEAFSEQVKSKVQTVIDTPVPYYKAKKSKTPVSQEWIENYREQERQRYENPHKAWQYTCQDGSKTVVAPASKRQLSQQTARPRDHAFLKPNRAHCVTILSLVRDACSRLVNGQGTRYDICELLKESQFINNDLTYDKVSTIVSGALDRLHYLEDPCIKYDQEKKVWFYLHKDRDVDDLKFKEGIFWDPDTYFNVVFPQVCAESKKKREQEKLEMDKLDQQQFEQQQQLEKNK